RMADGKYIAGTEPVSLDCAGTFVFGGESVQEPRAVQQPAGRFPASAADPSARGHLLFATHAGPLCFFADRSRDTEWRGPGLRAGFAFTPKQEHGRGTPLGRSGVLRRSQAEQPRHLLSHSGLVCSLRLFEGIAISRQSYRE